jgi:hypothetical protein
MPHVTCYVMVRCHKQHYDMPTTKQYHNRRFPNKAIHFKYKGRITNHYGAYPGYTIITAPSFQ